MCVANIKDSNIVNGSQGIIVKFKRVVGEKYDYYPVVDFIDVGEVLVGDHKWVSETMPHIGIQQIPLILAWAITIHKSQGSTLTHAEIDVGNDIFEYGQTYVALSRVKTIDGLQLSSFNVNNIKINKRVQEYYKNINTQTLKK
jgi:ATP-dependent DNA helicase PIF1